MNLYWLTLMTHLFCFYLGILWWSLPWTKNGQIRTQESMGHARREGNWDLKFLLRGGLGVELEARSSKVLVSMLASATENNFGLHSGLWLYQTANKNRQTTANILPVVCWWRTREAEQSFQLFCFTVIKVVYTLPVTCISTPSWHDFAYLYTNDTGTNICLP